MIHPATGNTGRWQVRGTTPSLTSLCSLPCLLPNAGVLTFLTLIPF